MARSSSGPPLMFVPDHLEQRGLDLLHVRDLVEHQLAVLARGLDHQQAGANRRVDGHIVAWNGFLRTASASADVNHVPRTNRRGAGRRSARPAAPVHVHGGAGELLPAGQLGTDSRPTVAHQRRYALPPAGRGRAGAPGPVAPGQPGQDAASSASRPGRHRPPAAPRWPSAPAARPRDVTLRPMPTTIASPCASARIPASFRSAASTSFGHFRTAGRPPRRAAPPPRRRR